jgi:hypothetical protein
MYIVVLRAAAAPPKFVEMANFQQTGDRSACAILKPVFNKWVVVTKGKQSGQRNQYVFHMKSLKKCDLIYRVFFF